ncbi:S-layer homology domain-containing protein [Paenibacillaceae bacterium WGS1546]|uniref:S-layer homology domain-containing protein n=1 Tax=Cohnella sp. WGS1546 TaxID=3366810 RepID=UPI00372D3951
MKKWISVFLGIGLFFSTFSGVSNVEAMESNTKFSDIKGHWAERLIDEAVSKEFVAGISADKFAPNQELTYEQFMTMLARMLTQSDFIVDKTSGCKLLITNYDDEYKATSGDLVKLKEYRENYADNNIYLKDKIVEYSSSHISSYNKNGLCNLRSWNDYNYDTYFTIAEKPSRPYYPADYIDISKVANWAKPSITSVPYVAGFLAYYDFVIKESNIKDFDYVAYKQGITEKDITFHYANKYFFKRIRDLYNKLNQRYTHSNEFMSNTNTPLLREDMALILYSFLNYEEQKLVEYKQDYYYYGDYSDDNNPWKYQDIKYKSFKSNYVDIAQYFQVDSMGYGKHEVPYEINSYYTYRPERIKPANASESSTNNSILHLTNRGIILAVSDAGLLNGSGNKFNPRKALTRAEGVAVVLSLEKFIKARYDFETINQNDSTLNKNDIARELLTTYFKGIEEQKIERVKSVVDSASDSSTFEKMNSLMDNYGNSSFIVKDVDFFNRAEQDTFGAKFAVLVKTLSNAHLEEYRFTKRTGSAVISNVNGTWKLSRVTIGDSIDYTPVSSDVFQQNLNAEKQIIESLILRNNAYLDEKNTEAYINTFENPTSVSASPEQDFSYSILSTSNVQINGNEASADVERNKTVILSRKGNTRFVGDSYKQYLKISFVKVDGLWKVRNITVQHEEKI